MDRADDIAQAMAATPAIELERRIMDASIPKSEQEWWARREIGRLRELVDGECRRAEEAHGMTLRQSLEIERLRGIIKT